MNLKSKIRYFIKRPDQKAGRRSYSIIAYVDNESGKRDYVKLPEKMREKVAAINSQSLDPETAELLLREIIETEYRKDGAVGAVFKGLKMSEENGKLLNKFWNDEYSAKSLVDEASAIYDFKRALRLLGNVSLYTASAAEIKTQLKKTSTSVSQQRRAIDRLRELLRYLNRDIVLTKPEPDYSQIKYLNENQVIALSKKAPNEKYRLLTLTLFGTGCRLGEALALMPADIRGDRLIHVGKQLTLQGIIKLPKRRKIGNVKVIRAMWKAVQEWVAIEDKTIDRNAFYKFIVKHGKIHPHCLRHSHAIHLLSKGANLSLVSNNLRNRIEICQKYYAGYEHTADTASLLHKLI